MSHRFDALPSGCYSVDMFGFPLTTSAGIVALVSASICWAFTRRAFHEIKLPMGSWGIVSAVTAAGLTAGLTFAMLQAGCQDTPDVIPQPFWRDARVIYQSLLIVLLVAATATDLESFYITDSVTVPGMILGLLGATVAGDLQIIHVWIDWNQEIPQLAGPYRPEWMAVHPHLHGFAWSAAGLVAGGGLTWGVRKISSGLLGQETMGLGDVWLMGMVGSFLGWQPTVIAFMIAPLCALSVGLLARLLGNKNYVPYGPYLSLASIILMFTWRWIWMLEFGLSKGASANDRVSTFALRRLFGDWLSLAAIGTITVFGLVILLGLSRLYQLIPVKRSDHSKSSDPLVETTPSDQTTPQEDE
ncbi:MAG: A24 family peptidase [Planctomycetaceae bacterium]